MKNSLAPLVLAGVLAASSAGCYGSNGAFNAVHRWNGHATGNRIANSVIHAAMWILPIYEIVLTADVIVFNNIEFITGEPMFK